MSGSLQPVDCSPPGPSVHGILQARILSFPSPGNLPHPGIEPRSPKLQADALTSEPLGKPNLPKGLPKTSYFNLSATVSSSVKRVYNSDSSEGLSYQESIT